MCGIAGIIDWSNVDHNQLVGSMCDSMMHRGPDGHGVMQLNGACFGHRRLSIIDLSNAATQPMLDHSGRYCVVFNGEIYGFSKLKHELLSLGQKFQTASDTEVILEGFKAWGIEKLCQQLNGMFAFALWDKVTETVYIARDRFGEKPLYFRKCGREIRFASSAKALYIGDKQKPELNPLAVHAFLHQAFCLPEYPILDDLNSLEPGSFAVIQKETGNVEAKAYWKPSFEPKLDYSHDEWLTLIENRLESVVAEELVSDVRIGALLSGGVDSSLLASIATEIRPDLDLFTVRMNDAFLDESEIAKATVKKIGGRHHIIEAKPMDLDDFNRLHHQFNEPLGDSSALGMFMVSEAARKEVTVVLTGDGGDELFAGYNTVKLNAQYQPYRQFTANAMGKGLNRLVSAALGSVSDHPRVRKLLTLGQVLSHSTQEVHAQRSFVPRRLTSGLLGERALNQNLPFRAVLNRLWNSSDAANELDRLMAFDLRHVLLGDFIPKVDTATMYHSLEARSPFLHHGLAELAFSMPLNVKRMNNTQKGITKAILKKRLGEKASRQITNGKRGFVLPVDQWLDNKWREVIAELPDSNLVKDGYLNKQGVEKVLDGYTRYPETYARIRYSLVAFNEWYKSF